MNICTECNSKNIDTYTMEQWTPTKDSTRCKCLDCGNIKYIMSDTTV